MKATGRTMAAAAPGLTPPAQEASRAQVLSANLQPPGGCKRRRARTQNKGINLKPFGYFEDALFDADLGSEFLPEVGGWQ
jgi:hypothetical protein